MGIIFSNSMLKTYQRCHLQYDYKFGQMLSPNTAPLPMKRGVWLHRLLQAHYTETIGWRGVLERELKPEYDKLFDEEKQMYGPLPEACRHIMRSYEYHWREEDSGLTILEAEKQIEVPLPHGHTIIGRIDLLVEDEYGVWLVEHKSHKKIPRSDYRFLDLQTKRYVWGLNRLKIYPPITGVLWNYLRMKAPTVPHLKKNGELSKARIDTDLITFLAALKRYGLNPRDHRDKIEQLKAKNTFFQRDRVPLANQVVERIVRETIVVADEIERGYKPVRSIERSCEHSCSYLDLCVVDLYQGNRKQVIKAKYHRRGEGEYYADSFVGNLESED